jgi:LysM repeat protein
MRTKILLIICLVAVMLAFPAAALAAPSSNSEPGGYWYQVKRGDTLASIARKTGVPMDAIIGVNGIYNRNQIWAGTWLWIPRSDKPPVEPAPTPTCRTKVTVHRGDTLAAIARKYGVSVWSLAKNNGIKNPNVIYVGQRLCIPWPGVPSGGRP